FRRLNFTIDTLAPLPWRTTVATTLPPAISGLPSFTSAPSPTSSTWPNSTVAPASASSFSMRSTPSLVTRYCFPPVAITAYIGLKASGGLEKGRAFYWRPPGGSNGCVERVRVPKQADSGAMPQAIHDGGWAPGSLAAPASDTMRGRTRGPFANDIGRNPRARPVGPRFGGPGDSRAPEERRPARGSDRRAHHFRGWQAATPAARRAGRARLRTQAARAYRGRGIHRVHPYRYAPARRRGGWLLPSPGPRHRQSGLRQSGQCPGGRFRLFAGLSDDGLAELPTRHGNHGRRDQRDRRGRGHAAHERARPGHERAALPGGHLPQDREALRGRRRGRRGARGKSRAGAPSARGLWPAPRHGLSARGRCARLPLEPHRAGQEPGR